MSHYSHDDGDVLLGNIAPKRGIPKLRELIADRKASRPEPGAWQAATTQRHTFRTISAKLVKPGPSPALELETASEARLEMERDSAVRDELSENLLMDVLSVCVRARDMKRRGRVVESWIRGRLLQRIVVRHKPTREGIGHDRYTVAIAFLVNAGVAEADPSGANGYVWTDKYQRMTSRAEWLVNVMRKSGEIKRLEGPTRYRMSDV